MHDAAPRVHVPRDYNAPHDLIDRNLQAGRADEAAFIDDHETLTHRALSGRAHRFAGALLALGVQPEQRVLLCLQDTVDFPVAFLGCILAGIVPVPVNTMLTTADYAYLLADSRARALAVSAAVWPVVAPALASAPALRHVIVSGQAPGCTVEAASTSRGTAVAAGPTGATAPARHDLRTLCARATPLDQPAATTSDDPCFWLYSSGSTGRPKGVVHRHASPVHTAELFARPILGLRAGELMFSAAKLFFAYGLGNGLSFPMAVGATTLLMAERATPQAVIARLRRHQPQVFCGVPTLFASLLADPGLPRRGELRLRVCTSAGESLPADIGHRWTERFGIEVLDGLGSTEMLHAFVTNRPGRVRYGTTGQPIPGFDVRVVDDHGRPCPVGEIGELQVRGPTAALGYWCNVEKTRDTFQGWWTRCGDRCSVDADGYYTYAGRSDDMLKVGGIYVSPVEVESALMAHPAVREVAVVGREDEAGLVKPVAYVVLAPGHDAGAALAHALQAHVKAQLAPYKYPRWIEFVDDLPRTATGKIQRYRLRAPR